MAAELEATLIVLGLEEYLQRFLDSGFGDWEALMKIAETQLSMLDVRLGHRRRLQRAIARERCWPDNTPLPRGPDLNQRVRDWLREEAYLSLGTDNSVPLVWPSQVSSDIAQEEPCAVTSEYQSSSENSSSQSVDSGVKVLRGLKAGRAPCLDLEEQRPVSKSPVVLEKSNPTAVERGVT